MKPSSEQIERWGEDMGDGWTRIPTSAWPDLLWCLRQAEKLEARLELAKTDEYDAVQGEQEALRYVERARVVLDLIEQKTQFPTMNPEMALRDIGAHCARFAWPRS